MGKYVGEDCLALFINTSDKLPFDILIEAIFLFCFKNESFSLLQRKRFYIDFELTFVAKDEHICFANLIKYEDKFYLQHKWLY